MFNRIRNYFEAYRLKRDADKALNQLNYIPPLPTAPKQEFWIQDDSDHTLQFNIDGEVIFSISQDGEAEWHDESKYNEAASIFLNHVTMNIESVAGIAQNRIDWEKRIRDALIVEAENAPLTADVLTDVLNKCIMYDKLKGVDSGLE